MRKAENTKKKTKRKINGQALSSYPKVATDGKILKLMDEARKYQEKTTVEVITYTNL